MKVKELIKKIIQENKYLCPKFDIRIKSYSNEESGIVARKLDSNNKPIKDMDNILLATISNKKEIVAYVDLDDQCIDNENRDSILQLALLVGTEIDDLKQVKKEFRKWTNMDSIILEEEDEDTTRDF